MINLLWQANGIKINLFHPSAVETKGLIFTQLPRPEKASEANFI
jgi:hypothetical protein